MVAKQARSSNPKAAAPAKVKIQPGMRPRHVPQRTCIACRSHDAKRGLVRVVRTPEGLVEIDETGKRNGRGAYLCRNRQCWEAGVGRKALDNALKMQIDPESRIRLKSYGESLPERSAADVE
jgi:uncharacterized protein